MIRTAFHRAEPRFVHWLRNTTADDHVVMVGLIAAIVIVILWCGHWLPGDVP